MVVTAQFAGCLCIVTHIAESDSAMTPAPVREFLIFRKYLHEFEPEVLKF